MDMNFFINQNIIDTNHLFNYYHIYYMIACVHRLAYMLLLNENLDDSKTQLILS